MLNIKMTIWDNAISNAEKNDILHYCERALVKTWTEQYNGPAPIALEQRTWFGFIAKVPFADCDKAHAFLTQYNQRLNHLHYWSKLNENHDECLVMEYEVR